LSEVAPEVTKHPALDYLNREWLLALVEGAQRDISAAGYLVQDVEKEAQSGWQLELDI
jgi:hypothetical protein